MCVRACVVCVCVWCVYARVRVGVYTHKNQYNNSKAIFSIKL